MSTRLVVVGTLTVTMAAALTVWVLTPLDSRVQARPLTDPGSLWSEPLMTPTTIAIPLPPPDAGTTAAQPTTPPPPPAATTAAAPAATPPPPDTAETGGGAAAGGLDTGAVSGGAAPTDRAFPPPGVGASSTPIGTPAGLSVDDPRYSFTGLQDDGITPIAYDPCRPIHYVVRPDNAPPDGAALIRASFDRVTQVTGLQFVDGGTTNEAPSPERGAYQPERYGERWAPVLVSWATEAEAPALTGSVAGAAGSVSAQGTGLPAVYVTGSVTLDGPQLSQVWEDLDTRASVRAVVLHEIAHLVGLGHVQDGTQLMNPQSTTTTTVVDYQAGDLTGLARLGDGACVPEI